MSEDDGIERITLAETVRAACLRAAGAAWEDGGIQGLCAEGRWELVLGTVRNLDLMPHTDSPFGMRRIYDPARKQEGSRVLVDRLWPRGVSKADAGLDLWARDVAPSDELRKWYDHDHARWPEFVRRYHEELDRTPEAWTQILGLAVEGPVTLLYASRERRFNNATALRAYLGTRRPAATGASHAG